MSGKKPQDEFWEKYYYLEFSALAVFIYLFYMEA